MEIVVIPNAKERMALRGITEMMIRDCIKSPNATGVGYAGREIAYKKFHESYLKVVYEDGSPLRVITVMWTVKPK